MTKIYKFNVCPEDSLISKNLGPIDYCDSYMIFYESSDSIDKITTKLFKVPIWVGKLMQLRNFLVGWFGLKTGRSENVDIADYYPINSKAIYFTVIERNVNEIVMAEDDKHLFFKTAVMKKELEQGTAIFLTTIVRYHNIWGKIYFFPVKPFHRIIMKSLLKRLKKVEMLDLPTFHQKQ